MDNKEYAMIIAKNLRRIMYDHGKTQADVARDLHISKATLSSWMNGTRIPRMNNIDMLCHYFNVKRADIMEEQLKVQTSGHPEWYDYPKTTKYMEAILDKPGLGVLLEGAMELSDENVDLLLNMIEAMKGTNPDG